MTLAIIDIATSMTNDLHNHTEIVAIEIWGHVLTLNGQWKRLTAVLRILKMQFSNVLLGSGDYRNNVVKF